MNQPTNMTLVQVLCLNHRKLFGIIWTSDEEGPSIFKECVAIGHRMFHFYGGISDPTPYAWIHPMTDYKSIEKALQMEINIHNESQLDLNRYIDSWNTIVSNGFSPEWFLFLPKLFFGKDDSEANIVPKKRNLGKILDVLTIEHKTHHEDIEDVTEETMKIACERKQAYYDGQELDREAEGDFLKVMRSWQKSNNLEQQWLGIMSMNHYLRNGIFDFENFYQWLRKNLLSSSFLIRTETLDMLQSLVVTNPSMTLDLIERLNIEREFPLQVCEFDLVRRLFSEHFYYGCRYYNRLTALHKPMDKKDYPRFKIICESVSDNIVMWLDHLISLDEFWHVDATIEKKLSILKAGIENASRDNFEYFISIMNRSLGRFRLSKGFFEET